MEGKSHSPRGAGSNTSYHEAYAYSSATGDNHVVHSHHQVTAPHLPQATLTQQQQQTTHKQQHSYDSLGSRSSGRAGSEGHSSSGHGGSRSDVQLDALAASSERLHHQQGPPQDPEGTTLN